MELEELIGRIFGSFIRLKPEHVGFFRERTVLKTYKAKELMLHSGAVERHFYFVKNGVQCLYLINSQGEKVIMGFSYTGSVSGVYDSFVMQQPSQLYLESITKSSLYSFTRKDFDDLFEQFPEFYVWRSNFIEMILFGRISREKEFMTLSAKERFDAFTKRCPEELMSIPQKYLASYLGMKPETFSRMRGLRVPQAPSQ